MKSTTTVAIFSVGISLIVSLFGGYCIRDWYYQKKRIAALQQAAAIQKRTHASELKAAKLEKEAAIKALRDSCDNSLKTLDDNHWVERQKLEEKIFQLEDSLAGEVIRTEQNLKRALTAQEATFEAAAVELYSWIIEEKADLDQLEINYGGKVFQRLVKYRSLPPVREVSGGKAGIRVSVPSQESRETLKAFLLFYCSLIALFLWLRYRSRQKSLLTR